MSRNAGWNDNDTYPGPSAPGEVLARQAAFFSRDSITRSLLDGMPGVIFVLNNHRQIVFANRTLQDLLGAKDAADLVGRRPGDVLECQAAQGAAGGCGTGDVCRSCGALMAIDAGLEGHADVRECLISRNSSNGVEHLTLRVWSSPVSCGDDQFTLLAGMDISHERRRLALERIFFHDIMNLVGSIRGFAELMEIGEGFDPGAIGRRIQSAAQRMIDEIDAQRLLLAVEKGQLQANFQILNSRVVLDELIALYSERELARQCRIELSPNAQDISFIGDSAILGRILGNMLKNALEASLPGESVNLGAYLECRQVIIWIHNPAVIPEEHQRRIFQRDFSTKGCGRGLGTYGMKMLAPLLKAEVSFSSMPGEGTTFHLRVPLSPRTS